MNGRYKVELLLASVTVCLIHGCGQKSTRLPSSLNFGAIDPNDSPSARFDASMTTDFEGRRVFLFGGRSINGEFLSDLWVFDVAKENWDKIAVDRAPIGRSGASLIWDPKTKRLILFGGYRADSFGKTSYLKELWIFEEQNGWRREFFEVGPNGRAWHGSALVGDRLVILGGYGESNPYPAYLDDLWALELPNMKFQKLIGDGRRRHPFRPAILPLDNEKMVVVGQTRHNNRERLVKSSIDLENDSYQIRSSHPIESVDSRLFLADPRYGLLFTLSFKHSQSDTVRGEIFLTTATTPLFFEQTLETVPEQYHGLSCAPHPVAEFAFICFGGSRGPSVSSTTWLFAPSEGR